MSDHVLVKSRNQSPRNIYHEPQEENPDRPKCDHKGRQNIQFVRKDKECIPHRRLCKQCSGTDEKPSDYNTDAYAALTELDPEAI